MCRANVPSSCRYGSIGAFVRSVFNCSKVPWHYVPSYFLHPFLLVGVMALQFWKSLWQNDGNMITTPKFNNGVLLIGVGQFLTASVLVETVCTLSEDTL